MVLRAEKGLAHLWDSSALQGGKWETAYFVYEKSRYEIVMRQK